MNVNATSLLWAVLVFAGFLFSVCLHEFGHAIVAFWGGDRSVKEKGYLTLNPLKYTHPTYSIVMPLIFLLLGGVPLPGAAVYINTRALKGRAWRSAVSGAGPLATLGVAVVLAWAIRSLNPDYLSIQTQFFANNLALSQVSPMSWLLQGLVLLLELEVAGALLNMIPVPGLDGFGIVEPWLPKTLQDKARQFSRFGILILFGAFWVVPPFNRGFWRLVNTGVSYFGVPPEFSDLGFYLFRQNAQLLFFVLLVGLVIAKQWQKRHSPGVPFASGSLKEKLDAIHSQLALNPTPALLNQKSAILIQQEQYPEAVAALDQSLTLDPVQPDGWETKGRLCQVLQRTDEAIAAFSARAKLEPQGMDAWVLLGSVCVEAHEYDQALDAYDQALAHAPDPQSFRDILVFKSRPYFLLTRYTDCLEILDKVLNTQADNAMAWYYKAACYARLGNLEQGFASLKNVLVYGNEELRASVQNDDEFAILRSHPRYRDLGLGDA